VQVDLPTDDIYLRTGPFITHLVTANERVKEGINLLYDPSWFFESRPAFCDFHVVLRSPTLRRWLRPKVSFLFEGTPVFTPSPIEHSLPLFEWGLNWVIAVNVNNYLLLHAAVVERGGKALILPGQSGCGKSTLCAGLVYRGWRLLSDELTVILPEDASLVALARPMSLKNESIDLIRSFSSQAIISRLAEQTIKGTIALAKPPIESMRRVDEHARPGWIVFPNWEAGARPSLVARPKAECFLELAANALNYHVLGELGFACLADVVSASQCYEYTYGALEEGVRTLTDMADAT
jgi:HprK-related kinase A